MKSMFQLDYNLQTINFGDYFDTSHVIDMSIMFQNTRNLQELDLSHFDTRNVTSMYEMFGYTGVSNLEFPNTFDTSNVEDMGGMFRNLQNIESLDLSKFDTSKVTVFESMFKSSTKLQTIIFGPKFIHKEDARAEDMYAGCLSSDRPSDDSWNGVCYSYGSC